MTRRGALLWLVALPLLSACTSPPPASDVQATVAAAVQATVQALPSATTAAPGPSVAPASPPTSVPMPTVTVASQVKPASELSAASVVAQLNGAGLPIEDEIIYTAETDPNELLGRPGQYVSKASWRDPRTRSDQEPGTDSGGTVEVFNNPEDRQVRQAYIEAVSKSSPFVQYIYAKGRILLRLAKALTPDQAAEYERALQTISG